MIVSLEAGKGPTSTDTSPAEKEPEGPGMGEDYQKVEFATLYWHKSTGYYYDPVSLQGGWSDSMHVILTVLTNAH